jgi:hypothetical protein
MSEPETSTPAAPVAPVARAVAPVTPPAPAEPRKLAVEQWAQMKRTLSIDVKAAARAMKWEIGPQVAPWLVTEAEFDHGIAFARNPSSVVNPSKPKV